jgi:hypothetical protein
MRDIDNSMQAFGSETDTISLARRLASTRDGCLIEIEVVDTQSGRFSLELASTDSRGGLSVMSTCHPDMDQAAGNVAAELLDLAEADGLLVAGDHRSLLACHDAWRACANSLNGRLAGAVLHLEVGETRAAMLSDGPDGLTLVIADRDGDAQPFGLDLGALRLGAWRHVTAMRLVEDALLAAVADPTAGFDLFCFDLTAKQSAPTLLMTRGAHRFAVNAAVSAIRSSPYGILIGTAALAGPTQSFGSWGPELLLVTPDRDWDLLVGQPRFSPDGLKVPASNLAPGFGDPQNAAIKAICHQELK